MANLKNWLERIDKLPKLITPLYSGSINEPLVLTTDDVVFERDNESATGHGTVELKWFPRPLVRIRATFEKRERLLSNLIGADIPLNIKLLDSGAEFTARARHVGSDYSGELTVVDAALNGHEAGFGCDQVAAMLFHLPNFVNYIGDPVSYDLPNSSGVASSRLQLESHGWRIEVDAIPDIIPRMQALKNEGGYSVTHVGKITHSDNSLFNPTEAYTLLEGLGRFFSFVRGRQTDPMLLAGLDREGEIVWNEWRVDFADAWKDARSWFDFSQGSSLKQLWSGFMALWMDDKWHSTIKHLIYWYITSNSHREKDGSIIITQTGLEELTWTMLVVHGNHSKRAFDNFDTKTRLRTCLQELKIPLEVPASLEALKAFAKKERLDGPEAFVKIRSSIIHPKSSTPLPLPLCVNAWDLGQWYIELALLRLCKYDGDYSNRTIWSKWEGEVEPVPWNAGNARHSSERIESKA